MFTATSGLSRRRLEVVEKVMVERERQKRQRFPSVRLLNPFFRRAAEVGYLV